MDGLTISSTQDLLESGLTKSEMTRTKIRPDQLGGGQESFSQSLNKAIGNVNRLQQVADTKIEDLATGRNTNVAEVMIAVEQADIAFKLMTQVRNKILDAYQEIMRMQV